MTRPASVSIAWLHDRQPVILNSDAEVDQWIKGEDGLQELLGGWQQRQEVEDVVVFPVSKKMSDTSRNE